MAQTDDSDFAANDCSRFSPATAEGRSRTVAALRCGRSAAVFQNCRQLSGNGRFLRSLHFSTKSANGGLQSAPVTGPENRRRRVRVESDSSFRLRQRLQSVFKQSASRHRATTTAGRTATFKPRCRRRQWPGTQETADANVGFPLYGDGNRGRQCAPCRP